jgi:hypothetical protein
MQRKEDKLHEIMEDVKKRQRKMSLPEKINIVAEMKNLQEEERVVKA